MPKRPLLKRLCTYYFFVLFFFLSASTASAQATDYRFSHLTVEDGLADNWVHSALMDSRGFMWFATNDALSRYDGRTFKTYRDKPNDSTSIGGHNIMDIIEAADGSLWIATIGGGLNHFDPATENFQTYSYPIENNFIERNSAVCMLLDVDSVLWVGTFDSGMQRFDIKTKSFDRIPLSKNIKDHAEAFRKNSVHKILQDLRRPEWLWLAGNNGLYRYNKVNQELKYLPFMANGIKDTLTAALSLYIAPDKTDEIWVGTWGQGLARLQIDSEEWNFFVPSPEDKRLNNYFSNIINDIAYKEANELWICSQAQGLLVFNLEENSFRDIRHDPTDPYSILTNKFNGVYCDPKQRLWFFNHLEGLSILDPANQLFQYHPVPINNLCNDTKTAEVVDFAYDAKREYLYLTTRGCEGFFVKDKTGAYIFSTTLNKRLPASDDRFSIHSDQNGLVWIAGGNQTNEIPSLWTFDPDKLKLSKFDHPDFATIPVQEMKLTAITEDKYGNIWIGTMYEGLLQFDRKNNRIRQFVKNEKHPDFIDPQLQISSLEVGPNDKIWMSTLEDGVYAFDPAKETFKHYPVAENQSAGLIDKRIMTIMAATDGMIWVGTSDNGIQIIDPQKEGVAPVQSFRLDQGLPNEKINKFVKDDMGQIWIGTLQGLIRYDAEHDRFVHYSKKDGLKDPVFAGKGLFVAEDGQIYIGQPNGYYSFSTDSLYKNTTPPALALTAFNIFEEPQRFEKDLDYLKKIKLKYNQNFFSISFAALNFTQPEKNRYAYILEGYDVNWTYPKDQRNFASYTKVAPGTYTFKLKAANNQYVWTPEPTELIIQVLPPPWRTWWAYLLYAIATIGSLYYFYRFQLTRKLAQQETQRMRELDQLKTKLYNNITHEFRTPLTLILGYINRAKQKRRPLQAEELDMMKNNGEQLLGLINQMLDLGKVDAGRMKINYAQADITAFLSYLTDSFRSLAHQKEIALTFDPPGQEMRGGIDKEKLLVIISNLLSNALKFTKRQGHIDLSLKAQAKMADGQAFYQVKVSDSGAGIRPEDLPNIFDRFYQTGTDGVAEEERPAGTGIGLSLVRELVELHSGTIQVESQLGKGTTFTILLPLIKGTVQEIQADLPSAGKDQLIIPSPPTAALPATEAINETTTLSENTPLILLVEDNQDLVKYITSGLKDKYRMAFAPNGQAGLKKAFELIPDLIISDVMMPIMDGFTMCKQLKTDKRSSHIPIIMLTARSGQESKIEGLQLGADVYLTKPFHDQELLLLIRNLLDRQFKMQLYYRQEAGLNIPSLADKKEMEFDTKESIFLGKLKEAVESRIDDPNLNVASLSKIIGLSHTQLHRKLVALTGLPPVKYIRSLRLEKAKRLLKDPVNNISDVAYATGFSDPAYFSRIFKKETGIAPTAYREGDSLDTKN